MSKIIFKLTILTALFAVAFTNGKSGRNRNGPITRSKTAATQGRSVCSPMSAPLDILKIFTSEMKIPLPSNIEVESCTVSKLRNVMNDYKMTLKIGEYRCDMNMVTTLKLNKYGKRPNITNSNLVLDSLMECVNEAEKYNAEIAAEQTSNNVVEEISNNVVEKVSKIADEDIVNADVETRINCHTDKKQVAQLIRQKAMKFHVQLPYDLEVTHCAGGPQMNGEARYYLTFAKDDKSCDVALSTRMVDGDDYAFTSAAEQSRFAKDMRACFTTFDNTEDVSDIFEEPVVEEETQTLRDGFKACKDNDQHILDSFVSEYSAMFNTKNVKANNCQYIVKNNYRQFIVNAKVGETKCEVAYIKADNYYKGTQANINKAKFEVMNKNAMSECNQLVLESQPVKAKKSNAAKKQRYRQNLKIRQAQEAQKISIDNLDEETDSNNVEPVVEETVVAPVEQTVVAPKSKTCSADDDAKYIQKMYNERFPKREFKGVSCKLQMSEGLLKTKTVSVSSSDYNCEFTMVNKIGDNIPVAKGKYFDSFIAQLNECAKNLPAIEAPVETITEVAEPTKAKKNKKKNKKAKKNAVGATAASLEEPKSSTQNNLVGEFTKGEWSVAADLFNMLVVSNFLEGKIIYSQNIVEISVQLVNGLNIIAIYSFNGKKCQLNGFKEFEGKMFVYHENENFNGYPNLFRHNMKHMPYTMKSCLEIFGTSLAKEVVNKTD